MYLTADSVTVESEEGRITLYVEIGDITDFDYETGRITVDIHGIDLDAFYDSVKGRVGPYLRERDEARRTLPVAYIDASGAYDLTDPKHPDHHSFMADLWDSREGK